VRGGGKESDWSPILWKQEKKTGPKKKGVSFLSAGGGDRLIIPGPKRESGEKEFVMGGAFTFKTKEKGCGLRESASSTFKQKIGRGAEATTAEKKKKMVVLFRHTFPHDKLEGRQYQGKKTKSKAKRAVVPT